MYTLLASRYLSSFLFYFIDPQRSLPPFALHFRRRPSWLSAKYFFFFCWSHVYAVQFTFPYVWLLSPYNSLLPLLFNQCPERARLDISPSSFTSLWIFEISPHPQQTLCHLVGHDFHFSLILILETSRASSICIHVSIPMSQFLVPFIVSHKPRFLDYSWLARYMYHGGARCT